MTSSAVNSRPAITLGGAAVNTVVLAACLAGAAGLYVALGQDANWDLQNYHYYNPWAFVPIELCRFVRAPDPPAK